MFFIALIVTFFAAVMTGLVFLGNLMRTSSGKFQGKGIIFIAWLIAAGFWCFPAFGHDHARPALNEWMKGLFSKSKTWCCDGNDNDAIDDWEAAGGKYRVKFRGTWYDVPESSIIDGPNKAGDAILWMNKGYLGHSVRCFMPGSLT